MGYQLAADAINALVEPFGTDDRTELLKKLNAIRHHLYSWEKSFIPDIVRCFEVQDFCLDCHQCRDWYRGITLPRDMMTIQAIWLQDAPVVLLSSWREWQAGLAHECAGLAAIDMGSNFPTERDFLGGEAQKVRIQCAVKEDHGKLATIRGVDVFDRPFEHVFALSSILQETSQRLKFLNRPGGFSKVPTVGRVSISDESGRRLSVYEADETVPSYRRYKIASLPSDCGEYVNVRALRKYCKIYDENDVVETDNNPALEAMARFLIFNEKRDQDTNTLRAAVSYLAQARGLLTGEKSRELGKSTQARLQMATPNFGRMGLRRRGW